MKAYVIYQPIVKFTKIKAAKMQIIADRATDVVILKCLLSSLNVNTTI